MGRLKKKNGNPLESMEQLVARAAELFEEPYDDRDGLTAKGLRFSYVLKRGKNGLPTAEIEIDRKEKTITRATICLAFRTVIEIQKREGYVSGPKQIGGFGASYLYPMFLRLGVIRQTPMV